MKVSPAGRKYGWKRDLGDIRDFKFGVVPPTPPAHSPPPSVDLSAILGPVYDQGNLGSCTANAIAGHMVAIERKEKLSSVVLPSRLFIYYNERAMEGTVSSDDGAAIRDGIKSVATQGAPDESLWPYNISQFAVKPSAAAYASALRCKALQYFRLSTKNDFINCLAGGFPFVLGFTVYSSFESQQMANTGVGTLPKRGEQVLGGHAVLCYGYDLNADVFKIRNSWGQNWGMNRGNFTFPMEYLTNPNLSSDFWTIRKI